MSRAGSESDGDGATAADFQRRRQNHLRDLERQGIDPFDDGFEVPEPPPAPAPATPPAPPAADDVLVFDAEPRVRITLDLSLSDWEALIHAARGHELTARLASVLDDRVHAEIER